MTSLGHQAEGLVEGGDVPDAGHGHAQPLADSLQRLLREPAILRLDLQQHLDQRAGLGPVLVDDLIDSGEIHGRRSSGHRSGEGIGSALLVVADQAAARRSSHLLGDRRGAQRELLGRSARSRAAPLRAAAGSERTPAAPPISSSKSRFASSLFVELVDAVLGAGRRSQPLPLDELQVGDQTARRPRAGASMRRRRGPRRVPSGPSSRDLPAELAHDLGEAAALRGRDPLEPQALGFDADALEQLLARGACWPGRRSCPRSRSDTRRASSRR